MNYLLEVDEEQLKHISKALDFYARIQMGQVGELVNPYMVPLPNADYTDVEIKVKDLKASMFPDLPENAYFSVKSKQIPDTIRQMVDIFEVIKHQLIIDANTAQEEIENLKPFHWSTEKELPNLRKVEHNATT